MQSPGAIAYSWRTVGRPSQTFEFPAFERLVRREREDHAPSTFAPSMCFLSSASSGLGRARVTKAFITDALLDLSKALQIPRLEPPAAHVDHISLRAETMGSWGMIFGFHFSRTTI